VNDGNAEQRLDIDVVRVWLERIPEENHEVHATLDDACAVPDGNDVTDAFGDDRISRSA
jgi:hypothetical protein